MKYLKGIYRKCRDLWWFLFQRKSDKQWFEEHVKSQKSIALPVYYIITRESKVGLFSYVQTTLGQIVYALKNNMIPIVDMKNFPNAYLEDSEVGVKNAWELFFRQICDKNIDDVYQNEKYILSDDSNIDLRNTPCLNGYYQKRAYWFWSEMYRQYVRLSETASDYCEEEYRVILAGKEEKTLGVIVRGTDYKYAKGHAMQPPLDEILNKVRRLLKKKKYQYIYLATDEKRTEEIFNATFPGKILTNRRTYFDEFDFSKQLLSDVVLNRENDRYLRGLEYLSSVYLLSKCGGLWAGVCGGTYAAFYMNHGEYKYKYLWYHGDM